MMEQHRRRMGCRHPNRLAPPSVHSDTKPRHNKHILVVRLSLCKKRRLPSFFPRHHRPIRQVSFLLLGPPRASPAVHRLPAPIAAGAADVIVFHLDQRTKGNRTGRRDERVRDTGRFKAEGGMFRTEATGDLVPEKSWIVSCVDDADAKLVARTLKKRARKRRLKANDWSP